MRILFCHLHLLIARHIFSQNPRKLTTFLDTNNLVLSFRRCASAPQRRRRRRATMAAAAHEISLRGIFRRRTLRAVSVGRCHPSASSSAREASVNGEASRRREMQIFRLSEWACMKTAICIQQLTENVSLLKFLTHIECFSSPRTILSNKYISLLHSLRCTTCKKQYTVSHQLVG